MIYCQYRHAVSFLPVSAGLPQASRSRRLYKRQQVFRCSDRKVAVLHLTEAVARMHKGHACGGSGVCIALRIANVHGGAKPLTLTQQTDIITFGALGFAKAEMAGKVPGKPCPL